MLEIFPFLTWAAAITSAVLLAVLWTLGELRRWSLAGLLAWFVVAAYGQFFSGSQVASAVGLCLQTMLAIGLVLRYRLGS